MSSEHSPDRALDQYPIDTREIEHFYPLIAARVSGKISLNISPRGKTLSVINISSCDELIAAVLRHHNKGVTFWAGINPCRAELGGFAFNTDIAEWNNTLVDIDPLRPKETDASDRQVEQARQVMELVVAALKSRGCQQPPVIFSGNGWHIYLNRPSLLLTDNNRKQAICDAGILFRTVVTEEIQQKARDLECKIDSTFDLRRIAKLPGTWSWKGSDSTLWRQCRVHVR